MVPAARSRSTRPTRQPTSPTSPCSSPTARRSMPPIVQAPGPAGYHGGYYHGLAAAQDGGFV